MVLRPNKVVSAGELAMPAQAFAREERHALSLEEQVAAWFEQLREPILRYVICGGLRPSHAEEVVQESFLRLYRELHAGNAVTNVRGWIFRVAHNLAMDAIKADLRFVPPAPAHWASFEQASVGSTPNPEELLLEKEHMARLHVQITNLTYEQQHCLYLRAEGLRYREIAEVLGVSVSVVAHHLNRAIAQLMRSE
jgi:RNA polymerase sigma-70 factor, ECF subfamily